MKKIIFIILIISFLLLISCEKSDVNQEVKTRLNGTWKLVGSNGELEFDKDTKFKIDYNKPILTVSNESSSANQKKELLTFNTNGEETLNNVGEGTILKMTLKSKAEWRGKDNLILIMKRDKFGDGYTNTTQLTPSLSDDGKKMSIAISFVELQNGLEKQNKNYTLILEKISE